MNALAAVEHGWKRVRASSRPCGPAVASTGYALARADWWLLVGLFAVSRILLSTGIIGAYLANTSRLEVGLDDLFCNWDCDWYVGIAEHGYQTLGQAGASGAANWAFFPLLPIAMAGLAGATGLPAVYAGLIIAQVATMVGFYLVFLIARDLQGAAFARHIGVIYAVWPFAVHAAMPMTEALFVPLTIAVFLFARRGDWLLAALFAGLLSATRTVGVIVFVPLLMLSANEFGIWRVLLIRPGTERVAIALGATAIGLAAFMIYLHGLTGDALAFSHNQIAWGRQFELPWMMMIDELNPAYIGLNWLIANVIDIGSGLVGFALLAFLWRRGLRAEAMFGAIALLLAFDSGNASSLPRYTGGLYPIMLAVAFIADGPLKRVPAYALLGAGAFSLAFGWGMEQFYVM